MYRFIRFLLFQFDPEKVHYFSMNTLRFTLKIIGVKTLMKKMFTISNKNLQIDFFGKTLSNPVGLAAGFDKNAAYLNELEACGFGFIEIGTVTPLAQEGNPKTHLFRLKKDKAIINRMGFNNDGANAVVKNLKSYKGDLIIGGNIGKNKVTPNQNAVSDYVSAFNSLYDHVDYFVVNVSSPNTPNLRDLQDKEPLTKILRAVKQENEKRNVQRPLFLKIAPDLSFTQLDEIIEIIQNVKFDGIIATNTSISRDNLKTSQSAIDRIGSGGLSGKPITKRSTEIIRYIAEKSNKSFKIIGVGGIHSEQDALEKLEAGADLIQLYTGFIYEGPGLVKRINKEIIRHSAKKN